MANLVTCLVPSLELHREWEYLALCRLTALCSTGPNKLCKYVPRSFIVSKLHERHSAGWALCSSATCGLFFWRGPKGRSSLVPKRVWQGCCFCKSCKFVSRMILRHALRWKDKSRGEMWNVDLWKECVLEHSGYYTVILVDKESRKIVAISLQ